MQRRESTGSTRHVPPATCRGVCLLSRDRRRSAVDHACAGRVDGRGGRSGGGLGGAWWRGFSKGRWSRLLLLLLLLVVLGCIVAVVSGRGLEKRAPARKKKKERWSARQLYGRARSFLARHPALCHATGSASLCVHTAASTLMSLRRSPFTHPLALVHCLFILFRLTDTRRMRLVICAMKRRRAVEARERRPAPVTMLVELRFLDRVGAAVASERERGAGGRKRCQPGAPGAGGTTEGKKEEMK